MTRRQALHTLLKQLHQQVEAAERAGNSQQAALLRRRRDAVSNLLGESGHQRAVEENRAGAAMPDPRTAPRD